VFRIESKTQNKVRDWNQNRIRDVGLRKAATIFSREETSTA